VTDRPATADVARRGRAFVELVRRPEARTDDVSRLLDGIPIEEITELACHHRLPGVAYRALLELGIDAAELESLRGATQMASLAHARCLLELAAVNDLLSGFDRTWLVVKGPVLVETAYHDPGARLYEDLDLVVPPSHFPAALAAIEAAGGRVTDLNWREMNRLRRAEIPVVLPGGMLADLHWHLLVTPNARTRFRVSMEEVTARRRLLDIGGVAVPTLDTVDGLLYLCLHGSLSGGNQLVWLEDIDRTLDAGSTDWDEVVRRARTWRVALVAAVQLARTRSVLGAAIPDAVVDALAGRSGWWRGWAWREKRMGMARWGGTDRSGRTFVAATSADTLRSATQLARSLVTDVARPALLGMGSFGREPDDDPTLYRSEGTEAPRTHYLEMVSSGAMG
jgi:Uncharacterised nucleotidyltransferase